MIQAVILAGGLGTRLRSIIKDIPKPMALIKDKPFLEWLILFLRENGIKDILLLTGYKSEIIENYFSNAENFGLNISFSKERIPLDTAGALFNAWDKLNDEFIILNGDTFFFIDYNKILSFAFRKNVHALIALYSVSDPNRYGLVNIDENYRIISFVEKNANIFYKSGTYFISSGIYYFTKETVKFYYNDWNNKPISFERDLFPQMVNDKILYGLPLDGDFIDIGLPEDFVVAQEKIPQWIQL